MRVLSLFDGMSCGQIALNRAGIKYDTYFASEIDKYAMQVTQKNFPDTIQLGSVVYIDGYSLGKIDLLIGGSPCQSFSFAGKRKGMSTKDNIEILTLEQYLELKSQNFEFEGQSYLFWEYMRLLNEIKPKYFLLENVMMGEKWERVLSKAIGYNPIEINSALVSAQNRRRLYWTNIGTIPGGLFGFPTSIIEQPKDKGILLKDILQEEVDEKYFLSERAVSGFKKHTERMQERGNGFKFDPTDGNVKGASLTARNGSRPDDNFIVVHNTMPRSSKSGKGGTGPLSRMDGKTYCLDTGTTNAIEYAYRQDAPIGEDRNKLRANAGGKTKGVGLELNNGFIRRLTPIECERLQTVEDNYTKGVSDSQRYKMLGNGWTIDVISHIFSYLNQ